MSIESAHESKLVGIALSGGGIRSATFNLGVLQALTRYGILRSVDYMSTVSGGGYIAGWLLAWIQRRGFAEVEQKFGRSGQRPSSTQADSSGKDHSAEPQEVRHLRCFSNYLTPRLGALGADLLSAVASIVRNLLLNLLVLGLVVAALQMVPIFMSQVFGLVSAPWAKRLAFGCLLVALIAFVLNIVSLIGDRNPNPELKFNFNPLQARLFIVLPFLLACWFLAALVRYDNGCPFEDWYIAIANAILWTLALGARKIVSVLKSRKKGGVPEPATDLPPRFPWKKFGLGCWIVVTAAISGWIGGWLLMRVYSVAMWMLRDDGGSLHFAALGPVLVFCILEFALALHFGLAGSSLGDEAHEWCARLVAAKLRASALWVAIVLIAFLGYKITALSDFRVILLLGWLVVMAATGTVAAIARPLRWPARIGDVCGKFTAIIFMAGLAVSVAALVWLQLTKTQPPTSALKAAKKVKWEKIGVKSDDAKEQLRVLGRGPALPPDVSWVVVVLRSKDRVWIELESERPSVSEKRSADEIMRVNAQQKIPKSSIAHKFWLGKRPVAAQWLLTMVLVGAAALLMSVCVGVNRFSLHSLYRNRLVRCYLGASRKRNPDHYAQFDPEDNELSVAHLSSLVTSRDEQPSSPPPNLYNGPYPIFNCAINLVNGSNLAWQSRKAASFIIAPEYCGFDVSEVGGERSGGTDSNTAKTALQPGYRPTFAKLNGEDSGYANLLSLGSAMTISGAAANPNMGKYSSPAITMLLTLMNFRLGGWYGNPRSDKSWRKRDPKWGLLYYFYEMFGRTHDRTNHVQLSDGGHFENLGIYELVRRRCRYIIAGDATQDLAGSFADIGNAIEKCRTDFGIEIEIDLASLRYDAAGHSRRHCAIGLIRYDKCDTDAPVGTLLYLKATLTGDEPADILRYDAQCPEFPHEATSNQWFGEAQWESYRALGYHIVDNVLEPATRDKDSAPGIQELFQDLRARWYTPSSSSQKTFSLHSREYSRLCAQLRRDPHLRFMDRQLFPAWSAFMQSTEAVAQGARHAMPDSAEERRAGFYFCCQLIQLMENVYLDLDFEAECYHPDNRGWMNLFRLWSGTSIFRATWGMAAGVYGGRFQRFCERELGLRLGQVVIHRLSHPDLPINPTPEGDSFDCQLSFDGELTSLESERLSQLLARNRSRSLAPTGKLWRISILIATSDVPKLTLGIGFALTYGNNLAFLRLQRHLRNMGLTPQAISAMVNAERKEDRIENVVDKFDLEIDAIYGEEVVSGRAGGPKRWNSARFKRQINTAKNKRDGEATDNEVGGSAQTLTSNELK